MWYQITLLTFTHPKWTLRTCLWCFRFEVNSLPQCSQEYDWKFTVRNRLPKKRVFFQKVFKYLFTSEINPLKKSLWRHIFATIFDHLFILPYWACCPGRATVRIRCQRTTWGSAGQSSPPPGNGKAVTCYQSSYLSSIFAVKCHLRWI